MNVGLMMNFQLSILACVWMAVQSPVLGQGAEVVPEMPRGVAVGQEVRASAREAVQALGNEVLKSNFAYAVNRMYPRWKARQAKRLGSEEKLLAQFDKAGVQMQEAGIDITAFKAMEPLVFYRVWPVKRPGVEVVRSEQDVNYHRLAFVPTKMTMRFLLEGQAPRTFVRTSFQVVIAPEGTTDWTFIDGATIKVTDLRSMFPLLPKELVLPSRVDEEVK